MIFEEGFTKKYSTLRNAPTSVYYIEDLHYKVLQLNLDNQYKLYLNNSELKENIITVNFPEFLDVATNLKFIKNIHWAFDVSLNAPKGLTAFDDSDPVNIVQPGSMVNDSLSKPASIFAASKYKEFPKGMIRLFFGYRYTAVRDPNVLLQDGDSLCCKQLAKMEDNCFNWSEVIDNNGISFKTDKPTVCKFKMEINTNLLMEWFHNSIINNRIPYLLTGLELKDSLDINLILHPPYISRMSFKDNIKILYPAETSRLKILDKITFKTNNSFTVNNKLYTISFVDKETAQYLFIFDSVKDSKLFSNLIQKIDTKEVNSYLSEEVKTFDDGVIITFEIPVPVQMFLSKHRNYKIRIAARDLTTQEKG